MPGRKTRAAATAALDALNLALRERDPVFARRFHKSALFVGSEPGELAHGRDEIGALLAKIFVSAATVQFEWASIEAARSGNALWVFADGLAVIASPTGEQRRPYRLSGMLTKGKVGWRWRLFHGSEPWMAPAPASPPVG